MQFQKGEKTALKKLNNTKFKEVKNKIQHIKWQVYQVEKTIVWGMLIARKETNWEEIEFDWEKFYEATVGPRWC